MGRVAPAPTLETFQDDQSTPENKISLHQPETGAFPPLHQNDDGDIEEKDAKKSEKNESVKVDTKDDDSKNEMYNTGRWGRSEKRLFLEGLRRYGKGRWKQIGKVVKTRSLVQIKSHGQKVLKKLETGEDIFAELDKENDLELSDSQLEFKEHEMETSRKVVHEKYLNTDTDDSKHANLTRTAVSRFSWMLPLRNYVRVEEYNDPDIPALPASRERSPVRKRKAWKREPTAKVARTDLSMVSVRSFTDEFVGVNCVNSSDIKEDTSVAVQALSELFLSTPQSTTQPTIPTNYENHIIPSTDITTKHDKVTPSRVEDAEILLSLMGKNSEAKAKTDKSQNDEHVDVPATPWWCTGFRRSS